MTNTLSNRTGFGIGIRYACGYILVIWAVHFTNMLMFGGDLTYFGIHPLDISSVWHIVTSPLVHGSTSHIIANTIPGAIFCFLIAWSGRRVFWEVTLITLLIGGIGVWFIGGIGSTHVGASGLIYGWLAYLIVRGIFNRSLSQVGLGAILVFFYSGLIWGVLPSEPGVSWQAHLFGAIGGILAGAFITSDDTPAIRGGGQSPSQPHHYLGG